MGDDTAAKELDLEHPIFGKLRARGFKMADLLWPAMVLSMGYVALTIHSHAADAKDKQGELIQVLKQSNKEVADALKESNTQTLEMIRQMALEQKKATEVLKELACLADPAMKNRPDARDFCRRISR